LLGELVTVERGFEKREKVIRVSGVMWQRMSGKMEIVDPLIVMTGIYR
jgi:hypothetical protein